MTTDDLGNIFLLIFFILTVGFCMFVDIRYNQPEEIKAVQKYPQCVVAECPTCCADLLNKAKEE